MKITLICNCGLVFSSGETCLLIDALTQELAPFYRAPESVRQEIVTGTGAYEKTCGLLFTHLHPDHYDKEAAQAFDGDFTDKTGNTQTGVGAAGVAVGVTAVLSAAALLFVTAKKRGRA